MARMPPIKRLGDRKVRCLPSPSPADIMVCTGGGLCSNTVDHEGREPKAASLGLNPAHETP